MASWDKVPRDFLLLLRLLALAGGLRAAAMAYYGLAEPPPLTPAEIAARQQRVRELASQGEEGLNAGYVAKAGLVTRAAARCATGAGAAPEYSGDCKTARLWLQRYHQRTTDVLADPDAHPPAVRAAAGAYAQAEQQMESRRAAR